MLTRYQARAEWLLSICADGLRNFLYHRVKGAITFMPRVAIPRILVIIAPRGHLTVFVRCADDEQVEEFTAWGAAEEQSIV